MSRWIKIWLVLFVALLVVLGVHVVQRTALFDRRMGDLGVFLRAAWAVRNDADLYAITDDNDWHYLYPPLYAILMTPLADPPPGADVAGCVPYAVSATICYLLNVFALLLAVHLLASALEAHSVDAPSRFGDRWWLLRLCPILVCTLPIGHTLMRGQVNLIVLAALCGALAGWLRGQSFRAGLWLSLAICIKVIPAYLLVYPLWRRDSRALAGCAAGCIMGLVVIPTIVLGPARTLSQYDSYAHAVFGPFLNVNDDDRTKEETTITDSIGVKNALHNWMYLGPEKYTHEMHPAAKVAYLLLGLAMTMVTLWPRPAPGHDSSRHGATQFAGLILLMVFFSPLSHMHYLVFALPMAMCLQFRHGQGAVNAGFSWRLAGWCVVFNVGIAVSYLPGLEYIKGLCLPLFTTLPLWVVPIAHMWRRAAEPAEKVQVMAHRVVLDEPMSYLEDKVMVSMEEPAR